MKEKNQDNLSLSAGSGGDSAMFSMAADKTAALLREMQSANILFNQTMNMLKDGKVSVELKKKYILKAIDETWVQAVEESLLALDDRIRNYSRHIEENEKVLPIELSRNITSRSLQHLAQHTEYIQKIEGGQITPSKILNVFRDETILTYENKFVNTLINRLYHFIRKRYVLAKEQGLDQKSTVFNFTGDFEHDDIRGKINFGVEIAETLGAENYNPYVFTTQLWRRVEKLYHISDEYISSDFVKAMGKSYIRPPVMRTNAILKNKNLKQCLALWEFIESYDDIGYGMLIQEDAETVDESYLKEIYSILSLQYVLFRYNIKNEFSPEHTINSQITELPISPQFVSDIRRVTESEFNVFDTTYMKMVPVSQLKNRGRLSDSEREIMKAIDVILSAVPIWDEQQLEAEAVRKAEEEARRAEEEAKAKRLAEKEAARLAAEREAELERRRAARRKAAKISRKRKKAEKEKLAALEREKKIAEEKEVALAAKIEVRRLEEEEAFRLEAQRQAQLLAQADSKTGGRRKRSKAKNAEHGKRAEGLLISYFKAVRAAMPWKRGEKTDENTNAEKREDR